MNLKKVAKYFFKILFVLMYAPIILIKVIIDPVLQIMIALVYALFNEGEASDNAMKAVIDKLD